MTASLKRLDAFVKPRDDLRTRSTLGGLITLVAAGAALLLFVSQIYLYVGGVTRHSLHLSESTSMPVPTLSSSHETHGKIPLAFKVTFPHVPCSDLDVSLDGESLQHDIQKRAPSLQELQKFSNTKNPTKGCTLDGLLHIHKVGGTFAITVSKAVWQRMTLQPMIRIGGNMAPRNLHNVSHYVHYLTFGEPFPLSHNPLQDASYMITNAAGGVFLAAVYVDLIPTRYQRFFTLRNTFQTSVRQHVVEPEMLGMHLPGLLLQYDFNPLAVQHVEERDNFFVFISSLVSIVGGVFVTVGLVTGCLLHSAAAAVSKKLD